jgi:hypothetical protein
MSLAMSPPERYCYSTAPPIATKPNDYFASGHRCTPIRNPSEARRSSRDRAWDSLPHLRAVPERPVQRLRARPLPLHAAHSRALAPLHHTPGGMVPQAPGVPLLRGRRPP